MLVQIKQSLKANSVKVFTLDTKSTGGNIVTVVYILLKAPNSASTHRYTQFLRSQSPTTTPFLTLFLIIRPQWINKSHIYWSPAAKAM